MVSRTGFLLPFRLNKSTSGGATIRVNSIQKMELGINVMDSVIGQKGGSSHASLYRTYNICTKLKLLIHWLSIWFCGIVYPLGNLGLKVFFFFLSRVFASYTSLFWVENMFKIVL